MLTPGDPLSISPVKSHIFFDRGFKTYLALEHSILFFSKGEISIQLCITCVHGINLDKVKSASLSPDYQYLALLLETDSLVVVDIHRDRKFSFYPGNAVQGAGFACLDFLWIGHGDQAVISLHNPTKSKGRAGSFLDPEQLCIFFHQHYKQKGHLMVVSLDDINVKSAIITETTEEHDYYLPLQQTETQSQQYSYLAKDGTFWTKLLPKPVPQVELSVIRVLPRRGPLQIAPKGKDEEVDVPEEKPDELVHYSSSNTATLTVGTPLSSNHFSVVILYGLPFLLFHHSSSIINPQSEHACISVIPIPLCEYPHPPLPQGFLPNPSFPVLHPASPLFAPFLSPSSLITPTIRGPSIDLIKRNPFTDTTTLITQSDLTALDFTPQVLFNQSCSLSPAQTEQTIYSLLESVDTTSSLFCDKEQEEQKTQQKKIEFSALQALKLFTTPIVTQLDLPDDVVEFFTEKEKDQKRLTFRKDSTTPVFETTQLSPQLSSYSSVNAKQEQIRQRKKDLPVPLPVSEEEEQIDGRGSIEQNQDAHPYFHHLTTLPPLSSFFPQTPLTSTTILLHSCHSPIDTETPVFFSVVDNILLVHSHSHTTPIDLREKGRELAASTLLDALSSPTSLHPSTVISALIPFTLTQILTASFLKSQVVKSFSAHLTRYWLLNPVFDAFLKSISEQSNQLANDIDDVPAFLLAALSTRTAQSFPHVRESNFNVGFSLSDMMFSSFTMTQTDLISVIQMVWQTRLRIRNWTQNELTQQFFAASTPSSLLSRPLSRSLLPYTSLVLAMDENNPLFDPLASTTTQPILTNNTLLHSTQTILTQLKIIHSVFNMTTHPTLALIVTALQSFLKRPHSTIQFLKSQIIPLALRTSLVLTSITSSLTAPPLRPPQITDTPAPTQSPLKLFVSPFGPLQHDLTILSSLARIILLDYTQPTQAILILLQQKRVEDALLLLHSHQIRQTTKSSLVSRLSLFVFVQQLIVDSSFSFLENTRFHWLVQRVYANYPWASLQQAITDFSKSKVFLEIKWLTGIMSFDPSSGDNRVKTRKPTLPPLGGHDERNAREWNVPRCSAHQCVKGLNDRIGVKTKGRGNSHKRSLNPLSSSQ
ncbi:hypothetical protein BLNAU_919 [Blattamonas nauphoetae]|uniref:Mic1 domain-containing protein n=1 Tax=Blattamonas nauphoetae TaxID=2049346 RepID=A0ABQ9YKU4_9EUKA|nr:hypothetical protein BLNAU_919 [Blattamonas nauphoetae]